MAIAIAVAVASAPALADDKADELFAKAVAHYKAKEFADAARLFEQVYQLRPSADVGFAWAQSERFAGNCPRATVLFEKLLAQKLSKANRKAISEANEQCKSKLAELEAKRKAELEAAELEAQRKAELEAQRKAELEAQQQNAPEPDPQRDSPADPVAAPVVSDGPTDSAPAWYADPIGGALVGAGVIGVGFGVGFYLSGRSADRDAAATESYSEFLELTDRAESRGKLGVISLSAGTALIGAGVLWYVLRSGNDRAEATAVAGWLDDRGGGLSVTSRF